MAEKSITKNAFYSFLKSFMALVFPLITFPYASRILLPEGIGRINFASSILNYFIMLAGLGISSYGIREASRIRNNKQLLSKFTKEILSINAISTFICYALFLGSLFIVPKFRNYQSLLLIYSIPLILTMFSMDWFFNAMEDFRYITLRSVLFQFSSLLILFFFVKTRQDEEWYAITGIFGVSCSAICNFFYSHKFIDYRFKQKLELKKHLRPIMTFFGMSVVSSFYCILDTTMLGFLSNDTEVGFYSSATKMNKMIITLITSLLAVLLPRLSFYIQKNDKENFELLTQKSFSIILLLAIPIATGLYLLSEPCILLLSGREYLPSILPMKIMLPLFLIITTASLTGCQILPAINKEKISLYSYIIGAISNFTLNFILIPKYGCIGAAIATITAEASVTIFQLFFTWKFIFSKQNLFIFFQAVFSTFIMGIAIFFTKKLITNYILQFFICTIVGILVYFILLLILKNNFIVNFVHNFTHKINNDFTEKTNGSETISVLLATYNGENYIREQLDSIINQTYKNIKIIVCDDNSKDNTFKILQDYSNKYENITIYRNEKNLGFKNNFEKLVKLADTNLIAFSDQDDIWIPNKLELCLQHINDYSIVCTNSLLIDSSGQSLNYTMMDVMRTKYVSPDKDIQFKHLFHDNFAQGSTILTKKEFILKYLPIPEIFEFHDWWFSFNAALEDGIFYLPVCTLRYRQHTSQVTTNEKDPFLIEFVRLTYKKVNDYYLKRIKYCNYFLQYENLSEDKINYLKETLNYFETMISKKNTFCYTYYKNNYDIIFFDKNLYKKILRLFKRKLGIIKDNILR